MTGRGKSEYSQSVTNALRLNLFKMYNASKDKPRKHKAAAAPAEEASVLTLDRSDVFQQLVEQVMDEHVISDEDLTALQTGESIIATLHYPPFLFRLRPYGTEPVGHF